MYKLLCKKNNNNEIYVKYMQNVTKMTHFEKSWLWILDQKKNVCNENVAKCHKNVKFDKYDVTKTFFIVLVVWVLKY